jgi:protein subunit release factor B
LEWELGSQLVKLNFPVRAETLKKLEDRYNKLNLREEDLEETFVKGGGKGGQKINKTNSCVRLTHIPSKISISCQRDRSTTLNRFFARRLLCDKLEEKDQNILSEKEKQTLKIRKRKIQKKQRSRKKFNREPNTESDKNDD